MLRMCEGMFAFLSGIKNKLIIARDRIGEKPLYYGIQNNIFFTSDYNFSKNKLFKFELNKIAAGIFVNGFIPTLYQFIKMFLN